MLENFKKSADNGNEFGALLTSLSKVFDFIDHELLIAKIFWNGVSTSALDLIHSYYQTKLENKSSEAATETCSQEKVF